jgi:hypothetical protein
MLKRLKVWSYAAALTAVSLLSLGCEWLPWNTDANSLYRVIAAILREDIFGWSAALSVL